MDGVTARRPAVAGAGLWVPTAVVLVSTVFARSSQNAAEVLFPLLGHRGLHLGPGAVGVEVTLYGVVSVLATLAMTRADHLGHLRLALAAGMISLAISGICFALARELVGFSVAVVLGGAGAGFVFPVLVTLAGLTGPDGPERSVVRYTVALSVALFVGPLAEAALLDRVHQDLRVGLWVTAIPTALGLLAVPGLRRVPRRADVAAAATRGDPAQDEPVLLATTGEPVTAVVAEADGVGGGRARRHLVAAIWTQLMYEIPFVAVTSFGGLLATTVDHVSPSGVAGLFGVFFGVSIVWRLGLAWRSPLQAKRALVAVAAVASVAGTVLLTVPHVAVLAGGMALLGVGHGITYPVSLALVADATPRPRLAAANVRLTAIVNTTSIVLPVAFGWLARATGYRLTFAMLVVPICACAVPALGRVPGRRRAPAL